MADNWFETWFNSPYYHILYSNRDEQEARMFITNLMNRLKPKPKSVMLDLACGKGRHAKMMEAHGHHVHGIDLSPASIQTAKEQFGNTINWQVHDMREVYLKNQFDYIFNLFTSFGYFDNHDDNLKVLEAVHQGLKPQGRFVLDFLNLNYVKKHMKPHEKITREGIDFVIHKRIENKIIYKTICFEVDGKKHEYTEEVQALSHEDFLGFFSKSGFKIIDTFGDYHLNTFTDDAERLIFITEKI